jgi:hypothetical protein
VVNDNLISIISEQTQILYSNIESIFDVITERDLYDTNICDWPLGEQIYHILHSLDQWFINPNQYQEPKPYLIKKGVRGEWSKADLFGYYLSIKNKIGLYIENLGSDSLTEKPADCNFTRLALIMGQYRHFMYHIGLIHGCLRVYTRGTSPQYFGLGL